MDWNILPSFIYVDNCINKMVKKEYNRYMNKTTLIIVSVLLFASQASAQEAKQSATNAVPVAQPVRKQIMQDALKERKDIRQNMTQEAQQLRQDMIKTNEATREGVKVMRESVKDEMQQKREEVRVGATSTRQEMKATFEQQREMVKRKTEEARKQMDARMEDLKKTMDIKREEAKKKIEANRAQMQEKLKTIKDEKKKVAVQTIDKRLEEINSNRLVHFSNTLGQMEKVLQNVGSRAAKAEAAGKDTSAVKADIAAAEVAIAAARAAIVVQSSKTYALTIDQENKLRNDIGKTRQALGADLKSVQDLAAAVRDAIRKAATGLAKIPGINMVDVQATAAASTVPSTNQ